MPARNARTLKSGIHPRPIQWLGRGLLPKLVNGKRALAYIAVIDSVTELPGYDRVEYAHISGWGIVVSKNDNFKPGDKCLYIETNSRCPQNDDRFVFLEKYKYRVKIQKMCRVYSQGLIMPLSMFPELADCNIGEDVTEKLGIKYYVEEDNKRKADYDPYKAMANRHHERFKKQPYKWLMKRDWGKKLLFVFFGKKKIPARAFPTQFPYISKTDEERIENMPQMLECKEPMVVTEKLDGTSTTFILEKKKRKTEFYVCSRNIRMLSPEQKTYFSEFGNEGNTYWHMARKYNIEEHLAAYLRENDLSYVCVQGETVGPGLQGNPLQLQEKAFYAFNFIRSDVGKLSSQEGKAIVSGWGLDWVPILDEAYILPDDMEEFKIYADAKSVVNPKVNREGIVLRNQEANISFKNVSRKYLAKKKEG